MHHRTDGQVAEAPRAAHGSNGNGLMFHDGPAVVGKLNQWDAKASVRTKPRRLLQIEEEQGKLFFTPELVPVANHPLIRRLGPSVARELQVRQLYRYLDFTTRLELEVINKVAGDIALGKFGGGFPEVMREDAYKLCTDEAHHAYFSYDMIRQVEAATGIEAGRHGTPSFLRKLRKLQRTLPKDLRPLGATLFAVVSETLISGILAGVPKDDRVVTAVRDLVADHAEDEGRHSAYFSQLFRVVWPALDDRVRATVGPLLPSYILAFLDPDPDSLRPALTRHLRDADQARAVIEQAYPAREVAACARDVAAITLRLFEHNGVMDDPRIGDAFRAQGLIDD